MSRYEIKPINSRAEWEEFLSKQDPQIYVQSWDYGEFNKLQGDDFLVLGAYQDNKLIGGSLFIEIHAKRGNFLYAPYCPILDYENHELLKDFFTAAKSIAKKRKVSFIRISPFIDDSPELRSRLKKLGFKKAPMHMIAERTWILPLDKEPELLMKDMKQNHRNLTRRSDREGVEIIRSTNPEDLKTVHELLEATAKRHNFVPFSLKYLEDEFNTFATHNAAQIYIAKHEDDVLAAAIVYFYGDTAVYKHGASNMLKPKVPASYGVQWAAIQDAYERGLKYYNFWGIAPEGDKKHPFYGITHFKKGFGGHDRNLLPAHDLPVNWKYIVNYVIETIRRVKRGF